MAKDEGIVWDSAPQADDIVWDTPAAKPVARATPNVLPQFGKSVLPEFEAGGDPARILAGFADPVYGLGQIADKAVNPIRQAIAPNSLSMDDVVRQREAAYQAPEGMDWSRMAGNVANPATWVGPGKGQMLAKTLGAIGASRPVLQAAATGAVQSALAPTTAEDFWTDKAKQAGFGAALGAGTAKLARGFTPTPEAKALMDQGIQPSFGQSMGGVVNDVEQRATSIPGVGDAVRWARNRPMEEWQQKVIGRVTQAKAKTLDEANAHASALYEEVVPHLKPTKEAALGVREAATKAWQNPELTDDGRKVLIGLVQKHFKTFGQLDGQGIKNLDSELGHLARKYGNGDPASQTLSDEIYNIQQAFRSGLENGLPTDQQGKLQVANETWRNLIPLNKAASRRADERITPRALQQTIAQQRRTDTSRLGHDPLIDDALKVLPQTVPDSGTAGRTILGALGTGAVGFGPEYLFATTGAALGGTRPMQRALVGNTKLQRDLAPYSSNIVGMMAAALRNREGNK